MAKNRIIDDSLKEKELLLKEIHHRVKNNLQIISSLLSLQSKNIDDVKAKQAIFEGKERIQAIALIHQKLYLNNSFATIKMNEYLQDLVEQLGKSYSNENNGIQILLKTNDIILNIDTVVPLGLIICELTTNAFKYAFENKSEGKLKVEINHSENGHYILNVKDDGNGMKENFDFLNSKTLGVEIVTALTEQLDGSISYKSLINKEYNTSNYGYMTQRNSPTAWSCGRKRFWRGSTGSRSTAYWKSACVQRGTSRPPTSGRLRP